MKFEFGVILREELKLEDLSRAGDFPFVHVIDTRVHKGGGSFPLSELIYRRLRNLQVGFDQIPIANGSLDSRTENELVRCMTEPAGKTLIITSAMTKVKDLCDVCDIPCELEESTEHASPMTSGKVSDLNLGKAA